MFCTLRYGSDQSIPTVRIMHSPGTALYININSITGEVFGSMSLYATVHTTSKNIKPVLSVKFELR